MRNDGEKKGSNERIKNLVKEVKIKLEEKLN